MRDEKERLLDIREAIERIEKYAERGRDAFDGDELIQTWVLHYLQIIGEAVRTFDSDFREKHPAIPWTRIVGMRNILVHSYFDIDLDVVWSVVENDLAPLKSAVALALKDCGD